jgi:hypothetical protein
MEWKHEIRTCRRLHGRDHAPKRGTFVATSRLFNSTPPINPIHSLIRCWRCMITFWVVLFKAEFVIGSLSHFPSFLILQSGESARLSYAAFKPIDRLNKHPRENIIGITETGKSQCAIIHLFVSAHSTTIRGTPFDPQTLMTIPNAHFRHNLEDRGSV